MLHDPIAQPIAAPFTKPHAAPGLAAMKPEHFLLCGSQMPLRQAVGDIEQSPPTAMLAAHACCTHTRVSWQSWLDWHFVPDPPSATHLFDTHARLVLHSLVASQSPARSTEPRATHTFLTHEAPVTHEFPVMLHAPPSGTPVLHLPQVVEVPPSLDAAITHTPPLH